MKNIAHTPTTKAHPRFAPTHSRAAPNTNTRKAAPDWKPQPCGLTRSELRDIVGEILG
ncbi:MAG TPA: hypothetical protein VLQ65_05100 [Saliniramus sp.]|nr:hypothetical protein [Saliniramus sp.]